MSAYVVIKTALSSYKCHAYRIKNNRVYFNGRAVNLSNVISITNKDGELDYNNPEVLAVVKPRFIPKRTIVKRRPSKGERKKSKKSMDVIVI